MDTSSSKIYDFLMISGLSFAPFTYFFSSEGTYTRNLSKINPIKDLRLKRWKKESLGCSISHGKGNISSKVRLSFPHPEIE